MSRKPVFDKDAKEDDADYGNAPSNRMSDSKIALFFDFDNIAIGVMDAKYKKFEVNLVLERLLEKGKIVVKRAYCDWDKFTDYKRELHEAAVEMIEIPGRGYSGKNSADIRMAVDAMDMCWSKEHIDLFVIASGDSDFSPLVSKLRENAKLAIGVGVKNSTSDLLISNCDEFIFYDDLVREQKNSQATRARKPKKAPTDKSRPADEGKTEEDRKQEAIELVLETIEGLMDERGAEEKIWGSMVKQTLKRQRPGFNESYYGFRSFSRLLDEAAARDLIDVEEDEKSGGVIIRGIR